jgi:hypothetical protein
MRIDFVEGVQISLAWRRLLSKVPMMNYSLTQLPFTSSFTIISNTKGVRGEITCMGKINFQGFPRSCHPNFCTLPAFARPLFIEALQRRRDMEHKNASSADAKDRGTCL